MVEAKEVELNETISVHSANMSCSKRWWSHLTVTRSKLNRTFSEATLDTLQQAIAAAECRHSAELRVVIEAGFTPYELLSGLTPNARALGLFSRLRVWDTEANSGVLLYVLLAEHAIELIADRGVHKLAGNKTWESVVKQLENSFTAGQFATGMIGVIDKLNGILVENFPATNKNVRKRNELSDRPLLIL